MRRLFEGGHYNAHPWDCVAPIRGRLLNGVWRLFKEIRQGFFQGGGRGGHSPPLGSGLPSLGNDLRV